MCKRNTRNESKEKIVCEHDKKIETYTILQAQSPCMQQEQDGRKQTPHDYWQENDDRYTTTWHMVHGDETQEKQGVRKNHVNKQ